MTMFLPELRSVGRTRLRGRREKMKRDKDRRCGASKVLTAIIALSFLFSASFVLGQTAESDAAESMGVGLKSRFASGATPIAIERTQIVPGTPMSVRSTMSNILTSSSGNSFGGILARYDTSTFGNFFGTTTTPRANVSSSRVDTLTQLEQGDNEIENVEATDRMYPPRLSIDFREYPTRIAAKQTRKGEELKAERMGLATQIDNVLSRCSFDRKTETVRVEILGERVFLRGRVNSARTSRLLETVLSLNFGGDVVVNELTVRDSETSDVDLFGRPVNGAVRN